MAEYYVHQNEEKGPWLVSPGRGHRGVTAKFKTKKQAEAHLEVLLAGVQNERAGRALGEAARAAEWKQSHNPTAENILTAPLGSVRYVVDREREGGPWYVFKLWTEKQNDEKVIRSQPIGPFENHGDAQRHMEGLLDGTYEAPDIQFFSPSIQVVGRWTIKRKLYSIIKYENGNHIYFDVKYTNRGGRVGHLARFGYLNKAIAFVEERLPKRKPKPSPAEILLSQTFVPIHGSGMFPLIAAVRHRPSASDSHRMLLVIESGSMNSGELVANKEQVEQLIALLQDSLRLF